MPKKKASTRKRNRSLPREYLTVEYPPSDSGNQIPVRAGARRPGSAEIEADRKPESPKAKGG